MTVSQKQRKIMIKILLSGFLLVVVFGLLILGGINRTIAKTFEMEDVDKESYSSVTQNGGNFTSENAQANSQPENDGYKQPEDVPAYSLNVETAHAGEWLTVTGMVGSIELDAWIIRLSNETEVEIEGRALRFLIESGFSVEIGDLISFTGFFEGGEFKLGQITNNATERTVIVRDENGLPMWGSGRR
jgi:hypothetical protein